MRRAEPPPRGRVFTTTGYDSPTGPHDPARRDRRPEKSKTYRIREVGLGNVGGDFGVDFGVSMPVLAEPVDDVVFDLADLDARPRPVVPLMAVYPPQARLRKLEGMVVVEFIVWSDGTVRNAEVVSSQPGSIFTEAAAQAYQNALGTHPKFRSAIKNLGRVYLLQEKTDKAITLHQELVKDGQADADILLLLGHALFMQNYPVSAESAYRQSLLLRPRHADAMGAWSRASCGSNRYAEGRV